MNSTAANLVLLATGLLLAIAPFYFMARPSPRRLLLMLCILLVSLVTTGMIAGQSATFLLGGALLYTGLTYFVLSFFLQHNVRLFASDSFGFSIGFEEFSIPLLVGYETEELSFLSLLGIPVWRPLSFIRMLRSYYTGVDAVDFAHCKGKAIGLTPTKSHVAVLDCGFQKLILVDPTKKQGDSWLVFGPSHGAGSLLALASSSVLRLKPLRGKDGSYKGGYVESIGSTPKLNSDDSYDLFGTFFEVSSGNAKMPAVLLRAVRSHDPQSEPNNLFVHWLATMLFLVAFVTLLLVRRAP